MAAGLQEQIFAEREVEAANKLSPETEEALAASHSRHIGLAKAQMQSSQDAMDRLHEELTRTREPQKMYLKRGSVYVSAEKTSPRPAEHVFVKRPSGQYESIGLVDSEGTLPDEEITP